MDTTREKENGFLLADCLNLSSCNNSPVKRIQLNKNKFTHFDKTSSSTGSIIVPDEEYGKQSSNTLEYQANLKNKAVKVRNKQQMDRINEVLCQLQALSLPKFDSSLNYQLQFRQSLRVDGNKIANYFSLLELISDLIDQINRMERNLDLYEVKKKILLKDITLLINEDEYLQNSKVNSESNSKIHQPSGDQLENLFDYLTVKEKLDKLSNTSDTDEDFSATDYDFR
ncbi:hypothetical protein HYPBUDRAFT_147299 [Hyphopichia burtonii NRRL Y-1933]|uniref:Uncharacterized protein n=1 Tax=Hyphopichia burtonii NRRL Y-1933 TaxID=984485 RepID=A0A1E4RNB4_9ASCO|nr:hypothetical protein HYPBUDRAFT_147299 [Hyphopichia burtonii NRRL Y-1933]ODV68762.1 hypothetical protein HYPBUDRAFT_147299 [Hyphopichia burtonii NRRL Y-1933]